MTAEFRLVGFLRVLFSAFRSRANSRRKIDSRKEVVPASLYSSGRANQLLSARARLSRTNALLLVCARRSLLGAVVKLDYSVESTLRTFQRGKTAHTQCLSCNVAARSESIPSSSLTVCKCRPFDPPQIPHVTGQLRGIARKGQEYEDFGTSHPWACCVSWTIASVSYLFNGSRTVNM